MNDKPQLLLSHIKLHVEGTILTVSRWLKEVLTLVGIDTSLFKGCSTRLASSSKAGFKGVLIVKGIYFQKIHKKSEISTEKKEYSDFEKSNKVDALKRDRCWVVRWIKSISS